MWNRLCCMPIRAVIFDVYGTLLRVESPPASVEACWHALLKRYLPKAAGIAPADFSAAASRIIARHHARCKARGIQYPEVVWAAVAAEILPGFGDMPPKTQERLLFRMQGVFHRTSLMPGAGAALHKVARQGCFLGIASNSQPYTLTELRRALSAAGLRMGIFDRSLCFFSFEHGFSKPDPHVFQILSARLLSRGIAPAETLMVGNDAADDLRPARMFGWRTWHLRPDGPAGRSAGPWPVFLKELASEFAAAA